MKAIVSPFKGLRIEDFMKIHGSMPDMVQIRSFLTVGAPERSAELNSGGRARGLNDLTMNSQPNRYGTLKGQMEGTLSNGEHEENKMGSMSPPLSKEVRDILDDLQNNQLQIYALWSEEGDVHRSFIQQPLRTNFLNTISLAQNGRMIDGYHTYGMP